MVNEDDLALVIGRRILKDADKLRLFMPNCYARFPFEWNGEAFEARILLAVQKNIEEKEPSDE